MKMGEYNPSVRLLLAAKRAGFKLQEFLINTSLNIYPETWKYKTELIIPTCKWHMNSNIRTVFH